MEKDFLFAKEAIKRKRNHICKECNTDIIIGEKYISVIYSDTITMRPFGAFHIKCWENFKITNN